MKIQKKWLIILFLAFNIFLIKALTYSDCQVYGTCSKSTSSTITNINYSSVNTNNSIYWQDMNSINSTQMQNNGGVLNIIESWIRGIITGYNYITSSNVAFLNQNNNFGANNITTTGIISTSGFTINSNINGSGNIITTNNLTVNNINFSGNLFSNDNAFNFDGSKHNLVISNNISASNINTSAGLYDNLALRMGDTDTGFYGGSNSINLVIAGAREMNWYANCVTFGGNDIKMCYTSAEEQIGYSSFGVAIGLNRTAPYTTNLYRNVSIKANVEILNNLSVTGNVTGKYIFGNGSYLTGIPSDNSTIARINLVNTFKTNQVFNKNITNATTIIMQEVSGDCNLNINHSICSNISGTFIVG